MATMHESAVLFSLRHLRNIEETRVREQNEAERGRLAAERRAAAEAEGRVADALTAQRRIEAERKARREADRRADEARTETLRVIAVEHARAEAEVDARAEAARIVEEHQRALAALKQDKHEDLLKRAVWFGVLGAIALVTSGLGLYFGKLKPDADRRAAAQQADLAKADQEIHRLRVKLAQRDAHICAGERPKETRGE
jgi:colicin import membrane protein